jgi:hypothetical protein
VEWEEHLVGGLLGDDCGVPLRHLFAEFAVRDLPRALVEFEKKKTRRE